MAFLPENTKIAIVGSGNIGTQFACICASKGYQTNVCSSKPELFDGVLSVVDEHNTVTVGKICKVSSDIGETVRDCQVVFVAYPAFLLQQAADSMLPYITKDVNICVLPGTGGAEFAFRECVNRGATLLGLQRVPSVARMEQYGKRVRCEGLRPELFLSSIPNAEGVSFSSFMTGLWGIPCKLLPNYLNVTLTPSNPILHTTRLRTLFADYADGTVYDRNPLFYGEWSDSSSKLLIACDNELQEMLKRMDKLDLHAVQSLKTHYESDTVEAMTRKLCSIQSLHKLPSPMINTGSGWVPDFNSRYFTADFPFGLAIIEQFADVLCYDAPNIKETMEWYRRVTGDTSCLDIRRYGIHSVEDIYSFYA